MTGANSLRRLTWSAGRVLHLARRRGRPHHRRAPLTRTDCGMAWRQPAKATRGRRHEVAAVALLAARLPLGACQAPQSTGAGASGRPLDLRLPGPSLRPPSAERPPWLPTLLPNIPRFRVPDDGFRDNLG